MAPCQVPPHDPHAGATLHARLVCGTMLGNLLEPLPHFVWFPPLRTGSHCSLCIMCSLGLSGFARRSNLACLTRLRHRAGQPPRATAPFCLVPSASGWKPLLTVHNQLSFSSHAHLNCNAQVLHEPSQVEMMSKMIIVFDSTLRGLQLLAVHGPVNILNLRTATCHACRNLRLNPKPQE